MTALDNLKIEIVVTDDRRLAEMERALEAIFQSKRLARVERLLGVIVRALNINEERDFQMAKTMDELLAEIGRQTTVEQGLVTTLDQLRADVKAAAPNADQAKIDEAFDKVKANTDLIADKLVEGTPNEATGTASGGSMGGVGE